MRIKVSYNEDSSICKTTLHQANLSKRKGARTEETVLTPKLKKFQLQYSRLNLESYSTTAKNISRNKFEFPNRFVHTLFQSTI